MTGKQDQSQPPLDKGCVFFCVLASIFFISPVIAWWWPKLWAVIEWVLEAVRGS